MTDGKQNKPQEEGTELDDEALDEVAGGLVPDWTDVWGNVP